MPTSTSAARVGSDPSLLKLISAKSTPSLCHCHQPCPPAPCTAARGPAMVGARTPTPVEDWITTSSGHPTQARPKARYPAPTGARSRSVLAGLWRRPSHDADPPIWSVRRLHMFADPMSPRTPHPHSCPHSRGDLHQHSPPWTIYPLFGRPCPPLSTPGKRRPRLPGDK
jgi:hypothetical protein